MAWGPASTITRGRTISPAPPVATDGSPAAGTRASVVISSPPLPHHRRRDRRAPRTSRSRSRARKPARRAAPSRSSLRLNRTSMRSRSTVTRSGRLANSELRVPTGSGTRIPVIRAFRSSVTKRARRSSSLRNAARPRCFLSCCRSFVRGRILWLPTSSAPTACISVVVLAFDTPKSRSMSRRVSRVRSSCSSWLMASGLESSHLGFAGTV